MASQYSNSLFSQRLKELLRDSEKQLKDIERETGIPHSTLSQWRRAKRMPRIDVLWTLSDYFGCSIDYLVGKSDD